MQRDTEGVEHSDAEKADKAQPQPTCDGMADVPANDDEVK